jgi:hypothetical protein
MLSLTKAATLASQLEKKLESLSLNQIAREQGFVKRKARKISPYTFLIGFFIMVLTGRHSLSSFAMTMGLLSNLRISKQAVDKRINPGLIRFLRSLLGHCLVHNIDISTSSLKEKLASVFNRILLHDSTQIQLTPKLADPFPGSRNYSAKKFSILKIQAVYELITETFHHLDFSGFTKNDQAASRDILTILSKGDLIIRDLGYFVLSVLKKISHLGAYFLCRYKHGILVFETDGKTPVDLLKLLNKQGVLDKDVVLGKKEKVPVRLVAIPVPEPVAAERRRKAKINRDRRLNPSKEHLSLMGWNIFVTNIDRDTLSMEQIALLYRLRWRIEIIFKSWKSHFHLRNVPKASFERVLAYIYSILIFVTLFQTHVYHRLDRKTIENNLQQLSLFRVTQFFKEQIWAVVLFFMQPERLEKQIYYHCSYEKRKKKVNYVQTALALG